MTIPSDATHQWLPAIREPFVNGFIFQRAYYKQINGEWYVYNYYQEWVKSRNDEIWFATEVTSGEFVEIDNGH